jgi:branched-chain amino acid transport system permease protein
MFLAALVVDGALAGTLYALVALAFVVVYKASRMINLAVGEWLMFGSLLAATGVHALGLGLIGAVGVACAAMVLLAIVFNRVVLRRLVGQRVIAVIMVTLGLGALLRGVAAVGFTGIPHDIPLPLPAETVVVHGLMLSSGKLVAAATAAVCIAGISGFFRWSRTGVALRAIADDQQVAMAMGIDVHRHFAITWGMVGVISVLAGALWTFASGGGFGVVLVGLKVFPIVIIGGLDSIPGTIVGAMIVGVLESLAAGYLDPQVGGGFSTIAAQLVLVAMLLIRPHGLFGRPDVQRV